MLIPIIVPGMEQANQFACRGIASGNVRSLVPVTVKVSPGEILENSPAAVLARDDVIDVKRQRKESSRQMAVLATVLRPLTDLPDELRVHELGVFGGFRRATLALDCMTARKFPICK